VTFGYLGSGMEKEGRQETFKCSEIVEQGGSKSADDFLIIRLEGSPGVNWGWYKLSDQKLTKSEELLMIHHPRGTPMKVSRKDCIYRGESGGLMEHRCDTEPGSSGAAILAPDYEHPENTSIVGVHTLGGCNNSPGSTNSGPSIRHLAEVSETIQDLLRQQ
jgi:V8-like Glu-specific endopeptidase